MDISKETVCYVAGLARIELNEKELDVFALQLNDIIRYIDLLKEVDTTSIMPTTHVLPVKNVKRSDESKPSLETKEVLANAPMKEETSFKVPRVIE